MAALEARRRVVRPDTRGHGRSGTPPGPHEGADFAADALAVMDAAGAERAEVMGPSLRGMAGTKLAADAPERPTRLIVVAARADPPEPFVGGWDDRIARLAAGGIEAPWEGGAARWPSEGTRADAPVVDPLREESMPTRPEGHRGCCEAPKGLDVLRGLLGVAVPAPFVAGGEDMGAPPDVMRAMAGATPGAPPEVAEGAGHFVDADRPGPFEAVLLPFLDRPRGRRAGLGPPRSRSCAGSRGDAGCRGRRGRARRPRRRCGSPGAGPARRRPGPPAPARPRRRRAPPARRRA